MTAVDDLIAGMVREEGGFQKALRRVMENDLHMTVNEFSRATGIPQSTMYKILEDQREPNLRTARAIIRAVKIMSAESGQNFIAVIASHHVLQVLEKETMPRSSKARKPRCSSAKVLWNASAPSPSTTRITNL